MRRHAGEGVLALPLRVLVSTATFVVLAAGCGAAKTRTPPPSELTGLVVEVKGTGSEVRALTLEADGELYEIRIVPEVEYGFDLAHLREHERLRQPVRVRLEERGGRLHALRIDDA